jgi:hypothetical protein
MFVIIFKTTQMKLTRGKSGRSLLDHTRNEDILVELKVNPVGKKLTQHKQKR